MKNYNYFVSRRNTPKLDLYTWLIGLAFGFMALNSIVTLFVCSSLQDRLLVGESIFTLVAIPVYVTDQRKSRRGLGAAISSIILLTVLTAVHVFYYSFWPLLIIYAVEILFGILVIKIKPWMFSVKKKQEGSKKGATSKRK